MEAQGGKDAPIAHRNAVKKWQQKMREEKRCTVCGEPREHYAWHCDDCAVKIREKKRKPGHKPWKKGAAGRPPKIEDSP